MNYEFQSLAEVDKVEEVSSEFTVLIEDEGEVKRVPKNKLVDDRWDAIIVIEDQNEDVNNDDWDVTKQSSTLVKGDYDSLLTKLMNSEIPNISVNYKFVQDGVSINNLGHVLNYSFVSNPPTEEYIGIYLTSYTYPTDLLILPDNSVHIL